MFNSCNWFCLFVWGLFVCFFFLKILKFSEENFHETGKIEEITFKCDRITLFIYVFLKKKLGGGVIFFKLLF